MIKPLIWKEFHEQRWKMAFGTTMLLFFTGSLFAARTTTDQEVVLVISFFGGMLLSLYSAMGVFAPERTERTAIFLASKPVAAWKVFICKWFFGWLNFVVPMSVCYLGLAMMIFTRPQNSYFDMRLLTEVTLEGICMATAFYSMTCCFAPRKSSEAFVGFVGLVIIIAIFSHLMILDATVGFPSSGTYPLIKQMVIFINPYSWLLFTRTANTSLNLSILVIEQVILLAITMWIGLRKLQRSI